MSTVVDVVIATSVVSLFSLVGIYVLSIKEKTLDRILLSLVAFSAGSILGAVYFDLLPEAIELVDESAVFFYITVGFILFFFLERFIYWYHGNPHETDVSAEIADWTFTKGFAYFLVVII